MNKGLAVMAFKLLSYWFQSLEPQRLFLRVEIFKRNLQHSDDINKINLSRTRLFVFEYLSKHLELRDLFDLIIDHFLSFIRFKRRRTHLSGSGTHLTYRIS